MNRSKSRMRGRERERFNNGVSKYVMYVIQGIRRRGGTVTIIKLEQILYLADIARYRTKRHTFTGFTWMAGDMGAYAPELRPILARLIMQGRLGLRNRATG